MPHESTKDARRPATQKAPSGLNHVTLHGKVSTAPQRRELPSGSQIVTLRIAVPREVTAMTRGSRQTTDWVDCVAWGPRVARSVEAWRAGDVVEVEGALRRRFFRSGQTTQTRLEVEVLKARKATRRRPRAPELSG